jgi:hypothetical protein
MSSLIETLVTNGAVTLIALGFLALELVVLLAMRRRIRRGTDIAANAISGLFLILALRSSMMDDGAVAIAAFLGVAFLAHVIGLAARLRL